MLSTCDATNIAFEHRAPSEWSASAAETLRNFFDTAAFSNSFATSNCFFVSLVIVSNFYISVHAWYWQDLRVECGLQPSRLHDLRRRGTIAVCVGNAAMYAFCPFCEVFFFVSHIVVRCQSQWKCRRPTRIHTCSVSSPFASSVTYIPITKKGHLGPKQEFVLFHLRTEKSYSFLPCLKSGSPAFHFIEMTMYRFCVFESTD